MCSSFFNNLECLKFSTELPLAPDSLKKEIERVWYPGYNRRKQTFFGEIIHSYIHTYMHTSIDFDYRKSSFKPPGGGLQFWTLQRGLIRDGGILTKSNYIDVYVLAFRFLCYIFCGGFKIQFHESNAYKFEKILHASHY